MLLEIGMAMLGVNEVEVFALLIGCRESNTVADPGFLFGGALR